MCDSVSVSCPVESTALIRSSCCPIVIGTDAAIAAPPAKTCFPSTETLISVPAFGCGTEALITSGEGSTEPSAGRLVTNCSLFSAENCLHCESAVVLPIDGNRLQPMLSSRHLESALQHRP